MKEILQRKLVKKLLYMKLSQLKVRVRHNNTMIVAERSIIIITLLVKTTRELS